MTKVISACSAAVALLLALSPAACATAAGGEQVGRATTGARPGAADAAAPSARGALFTHAVWSPALGVGKRALVYLPPSYAAVPDRRFPVAYYLHGMWGSERDWQDQARIAHVADSLIALGMPELIIVLPDGDNGYYTNWATPGTAASCRAGPPIPEPAETYCVETPRYEDYIVRDLVSWVDSSFRTLATSSHRGIAGLSMGGYGAITLALRHPDTWSAAASHSGVLSLLGPRGDDGGRAHRPSIEEIERGWGPRFWPLIVPVFGRDTADWWAREPARLAGRRESGRTMVPSLFIDVGTSDALVLGGNRHFRGELQRLGVDAEYREWPGGHTWTYWRTHLPESLRWLSERIGPR